LRGLGEKLDRRPGPPKPHGWRFNKDFAAAKKDWTKAFRGYRFNVAISLKRRLELPRRLRSLSNEASHVTEVVGAMLKSLIRRCKRIVADNFLQEGSNFEQKHSILRSENEEQSRDGCAEESNEEEGHPIQKPNSPVSWEMRLTLEAKTMKKEEDGRGRGEV
jgi:hypothetical protein